MGVGAVVEASLLSQDPVYPPLTTPVFDLLTAADGKDRSLELWAGQVREGGVRSTQSATTAQGHRDRKLLVACWLTWMSSQYAKQDRLGKRFLSPLLNTNCNRQTIPKLSLTRRCISGGRRQIDSKSPPFLLDVHLLSYTGFPLLRVLLCGPFMGQGASYAPLLAPCWWMGSLWACGNKLNPSIYLHMARPIHLL